MSVCAASGPESGSALKSASAGGPCCLALPSGRLELGGRTLIMGIVNITPDSFSDGGLFYDQDKAIAHGVELWRQGAHILDVGGETTRPGSEPVPLDEELRRVLPVIKALRRQTRAVISVDTNKSPVAEQALEAGAEIINDISALRWDPAMAEVAARHKAAVVLMHMLGRPATMQENPVYGDVLAEVKSFLAERANYALAQGIAAASIIVDPGIGFGKTIPHNLTLLKNLPELAAMGYPLLLAASRKGFIGRLTGKPPLERVIGSVTVHALGAYAGAHMVRVHDVEAMREALLVADAIRAAS